MWESDIDSTGAGIDPTPVVVLVGATASGKTKLSLELAKRLRGEIVNADAMQFYRGLDIGTAKATRAERESTPHHLIDVLNLDEEASAAQFQDWARECFTQLRSRGSTPILTGGSGLYVRAAVDQMRFPPTDPEVRAELLRRLEEEGNAAIRAELVRVDPDSAHRINDDRRLVRALEVYQVTGEPFTAFMPQRIYAETVAPVVQIGLSINRDTLHERIAFRTKAMMADGFLDEVRHLSAHGLDSAPTASRAIGYPQMQRALRGETTVDEAIDDTIVATRRFAKRQLTWFRADPRVHWIEHDDPRLVNKALNLITDR